MSIRRVVPFAVLAGVLAGCSLFDPGPSVGAATANPVPAEAARLVIYRPNGNSLLGVVGDRPISINGAPACALANESFFVHDAPAGVITISDGKSSLEVTAEAGKQYFVRVAFNQRRASLVGWVPPLFGYEVGQTPPPAEAGFFAIEQIDPPKAAPELTHVTLDTGCH